MLSLDSAMKSLREQVVLRLQKLHRRDGEPALAVVALGGETVALGFGDARYTKRA